MPVILYTLFLASLMPILMAWLGAYFRVKQLGRFDNHHPRLQQSEMTGIGARAQGAQMNAWEALIVYTMTCFIAFASGLDLHRLDAIAVAFLSFRILHALFYVANFAWLRSISYGLSMLCCIYIVYLAATQ